MLLHALPRRGGFVDRRSLESRARALLREVGLEARTRELLREVEPGCPPPTLVEELAPGERQLVEIVKALAASARVVFLDEPTTSLTAPEAQRLFAILGRLREQGRGIVYVSQ